MLNWSLKEIRVVYEKFQRRSNTNTPFIDKIFFCKLVPFTRSNAAYIFDSFSRKKEFISIYEFLCIDFGTGHSVFGSEPRIDQS